MNTNSLGIFFADTFDGCPDVPWRSVELQEDPWKLTGALRTGPIQRCPVLANSAEGGMSYEIPHETSLNAVLGG